MRIPITVEATRNYADIFVPEIEKGLGMKLDYRGVEEGRDVRGLYTIGGIIYTPNPPLSFPEEKLEMGVLHEFGHIANKTINPNSPDLIELNLNDMENDMWKYIHNEGSAEVWGLDIFPEMCNVSEQCKKIIDTERKIHENHIQNDRLVEHGFSSAISTGYNLFRSIYINYGLDGLVNYIKHMHEFDTPKRNDFLFPDPYLERLDL